MYDINIYEPIAPAQTSSCAAIIALVHNIHHRSVVWVTTKHLLVNFVPTQYNPTLGWLVPALT